MVRFVRRLQELVKSFQTLTRSARTSSEELPGTLQGTRMISLGTESAEDARPSAIMKETRAGAHTAAPSGLPSGPEFNFLGHIATSLAKSTDASMQALIEPLMSELSKVTSLEDQKKLREDWIKEREKRMKTEEEKFDLQDRQLRSQLAIAHFRLLQATHELHTRGLIESFENDWKTLRGITTWTDRIALWKDLKMEKKKDLTGAMHNGVLLISKEMFSVLEKIVDGIYKGTSTGIHGLTTCAGAVHVDIDRLTHTEIRVVKALCIVYGLPWKLFRAGRVVLENGPVDPYLWDGLYSKPGSPAAEDETTGPVENANDGPVTKKNDGVPE